MNHYSYHFNQNKNSNYDSTTENDDYNYESSNDEKKISNDEEMKQNQEIQDKQEEIQQRGPGCPSYIKTGKSGRPRKEYKVKQANLSLALDDPTNVKEVLNRSDKQLLNAMKIEYKTLIENGTWILVQRPNNKKILSNQGVFRIKKTQEGKIDKYKARLVVRGCMQKEDVDYDEVFAPVVRYETIRTLLACAVNEEMRIHQMDVISAYVQGNLNKELYMDQPGLFVREGDEDKVCLLKKPFYGLKQAGREWYIRLNDYLTKIGAKNDASNPCVYVYGENENTVIVLIYVDDLILASKNIDNLAKLKNKLKQEFHISDLSPISQILGINVERNEATGKIKLNQRKYINKLISRFGMAESKTVSTPCDVSQKLIEKDEEPKMK